MTKSEFIEQLARKNPDLELRKVDSAVDAIIEQITKTLAKGDQVSVRRFGTFSMHYHKSRIGRNPRSGEKVQLKSKAIPRFKAGKELKDRVNNLP